jgi:hypothetical protein
MMWTTDSTRVTSRGLACWLLACAFTVVPLAAAAQVTVRPTPRPIVTAENERWYLEGQAITYSGSFYYPAGAAVFFNPYEMVRSGEYRGIPLYAMKTREPYAVVYVPVDRGLMQPYERRRGGEMAGTVGSTAPSFPVDRDNEAVEPDTGLQAMSPPMVREFYPIYGSGATDTGDVYVPSAPAHGAAPPVAAPVGPLTTALKPTGLNAFYIDHLGRRWFAQGHATLLDPAKFARSGEYHGFPVYVSTDAPADTIYVAVAESVTGLVTPYSTKR